MKIYNKSKSRPAGTMVSPEMIRREPDTFNDLILFHLNRILVAALNAGGEAGTRTKRAKIKGVKFAMRGYYSLLAVRDEHVLGDPAYDPKYNAPRLVVDDRLLYGDEKELDDYLDKLMDWLVEANKKLRFFNLIQARSIGDELV